MLENILEQDMLTKSEFEKLMHDVKMLAQVIPIIVDEPDATKRQKLGKLLENVGDRIVADMSEMKEQRTN
jgi:hypothetical protein